VTNATFKQAQLVVRLLKLTHQPLPQGKTETQYLQSLTRLPMSDVQLVIDQLNAKTGFDSKVSLATGKQVSYAHSLHEKVGFGPAPEFKKMTAGDISLTIKGYLKAIEDKKAAATSRVEDIVSGKFDTIDISDIEF
jgi:hypothetical protein